MTSFRIGIDSYSLNPLRLDPFALLEWTAEQGGQGVQFSELHLPAGREVDEAFLQELADAARARRMYVEWGGGQHVPFDTSSWQPKDLLPGNRRAAEQAQALGTGVVRSCSGGFFRWHDDAPSTEDLLEAMAAALRPQRGIFEDVGVTLAIELHFEFTTFELVRMFEMCDAEPGGWLGVCLDTFNMLPMLEDPVAGTERILPWVVSTHVKDGGMALAGKGLLSFPTAIGEGVIDLRAIIRQLATLDRPVNLSVEDHGGSFKTPFFDESFLARFPDVTPLELRRLVDAAQVGHQRMLAGELVVTTRDEWPALCEERTRGGLENLGRLVREIGAESA